MADEEKHGVAYSYANIGNFASPGWLGRVVGFAGNLLMGFAYTYAYVLEYVAGGARELEDGTIRHLEDGTERITE